MKKIILRGVALVFAGAVVFALVLVGIAELRYRRTFDVPLVPLEASDDPDVIERGRYLAFGPAHCADCHGPADSVVEGVEGYPPMEGGFSVPTPLGELRMPNITPDDETGIGKCSDGELARSLRHGMRCDGRAMMPVMEYQGMSDDDIVALLSYLRAQPAVKNEVPEHDLTVLSKLLLAFVFEPIVPAEKPPAKSPPGDPTIERGEYLVTRVAQCAACHSERDMSDLSYVGPKLAGGMEMEEAWAPDVIFVPPNLTPDPETGYIARWSEQQFVDRMLGGKFIDGSPMPWSMYKRMTQDDLRAIYRYLMSIEGVHNPTGPTVRRAGD